MIKRSAFRRCRSSHCKFPSRRKYLTEAELKRLMAAAQKSSRYGHRDATMILLAFRHGLRAGELVDLQWHQVDLTSGHLHVHRLKNGTPSVHPLQGRSSVRCAVCSATANRHRTSSPPSAADP